ncbi:MAG TPA: hypothetical protein VGL76_11660 [Gaiellaceae bacterium]
MLRHSRHELDRAVRRAYVMRESGPARTVPADPVVLRLNRIQDEIELDTLGRLEGRPVREGCFVVAEIAGQVVAALPLDGGKPFADPFRPTAHLLPLLELRAKQLTEYTPRRARLMRAAARAFSRA